MSFLKKIELDSGTVSLPSIAFSDDINLDTGFYRIGEGNIGISINGAKRIDIGDPATSWTNGSVVNIGTSGTTSALNIYGDATVYGALNLSGSLSFASTISFTGVGSNVLSDGTIYVAPATTNVVANNSDHYFSVYTAPVLTSGNVWTVPNASTLYIAGSPTAGGSATITNAYSLLVATGNSYFGGQILASSGTVSLPGYSFISDSGLNAGFYLIGENNIGVTTDGVKRIDIANTITSWTNGHTVNIGTSGTTSPLNVYGLITGTNGLTISSGATSLQATTTNGLLTAVLGMNVTTGQTLNVGTSGTTSPLNVFGLITGTNGLTVSSGTSALQDTTTTTLTTSGLLTANLGFTSANGQTVNIGTSGITSTLNVYGISNYTNTATYTSTGNTTISTGTFYVAPASTTVPSSGNNYYFSAYAISTLTNGTAQTVANAYTVYIDGPPTAGGSVTITNAYASYIASGVSYFGGQIQVASGSASAPAITFSTDSGLNTGFYRIGEDNIGIATNGSNRIDIGNTTTSFVTGHTVNIGTSGTTSPLNVFGLVTGTNGLTISSGATSLQALTTNGLLTTNAGLTSVNGQTVNVGTSGISSTLNVFGPSNQSGISTFTGIGNTTSATGSVYIAPVSTAITGSNNYFFSSFAVPATTGSTTGSAYTVYIAGAPSGTITTPYAFYVNAGISYFGGQLQVASGSASAPAITFSTDTGLNTGFYRIGEDNIGIATNGSNRIDIGNTITSFITGHTVNIGTSGTTSLLNVFGLITGTNGLTISSGATSLQSLTTNGLLSAVLGVTITTGQTLNVGTSGTTSPANIYGLITGTNGLTISSGATSLQALTTNGLLTAVLGITVTTGQTVNIGTSGTTSPLNVFGLITGTNGLTISSGATSLQALTTNGLLTANAGITSVNGQIVNVGTSGISSTLNVFGPSNTSGIVTFTGVGNTTSATGSLYIVPASTAVTGSNNYFFSSFAAPATTGSTTGSAYTMYIAGAPSGTITTPYAFYVNAGISYFGGQLQVASGSASAPAITFSTDTGLNTGFYRIGEDNIGIATNGSNRIDIGNTTTSFVTGHTVNIGTSGTTSPLNVFGLITGSNGLTISSGITTLASDIVFTTDSIIRRNTSDGADTGLLVLTGGGADSAADRGSKVFSFGNENGSFPGLLGLVAGNVASGAIKFYTGNQVERGSFNNSGLFTITAGLTSVNGQTVNVGTSGLTSTLNVFGPSNQSGISTFTGIGNTTSATGSVYVAPVSTAVTGANNYFFSSFAVPATTGSTTGSAYTMYIAGAPSGTITTPYAFYVNGGISYFGGQLQVASGSASAPAITFSTDSGLNTGFYRIGEDNIGIATNGSNRIDIGNTTTSFVNGHIVQVGTSGISSTLNIFGPSNHSGIGTFTGIGNTTSATGSVYVAPVSTAVTGSNNYFFSSFAVPATTGSTTGSAYTMYIAGAPSGTITTPFAFYVAAGKSYIGGALQIPTGAVTNYHLTSDANGNATWQRPTIPTYTSTATGTITTNAIAAAPATVTVSAGGANMVVTPESGTYSFTFNAGFRNTNNINRSGFFQFTKNGTAVAAFINYIGSSTAINTSIFIRANISCNGTDVIGVQWYGSNTSSSMSNHVLNCFRTGA